ncbi:hypothetical protein BC832DRAFT_371677 [Gaertneriomyces semiglobifer]|nr:hypothetical protein BC832DRAFT_371677 [Gaertneriomyces semiglobifer]
MPDAVIFSFPRLQIAFLNSFNPKLIRYTTDLLNPNSLSPVRQPPGIQNPLVGAIPRTSGYYGTALCRVLWSRSRKPKRELIISFRVDSGGLALVDVQIITKSALAYKGCNQIGMQRAVCPIDSYSEDQAFYDSRCPHRQDHCANAQNQQR